jgi:transcriptional regulator with XRE-family HTH domain
MDTLGERLQWVRQKVGLNHKDFARSIGLSPSGYHTLLSRGSKVSRPQTLAIEAVHGIRAEWILTGEGLRQADARERLDVADQAMLESIEALNAGDRCLEDFIVWEIERGFSDQSTNYLGWLNRSEIQGKLPKDAFNAAWSEYEQKRIEQQELLSKLQRHIRGLKEGNLKQMIVRPLLLALHFRERWESVRDRSMDFRAMQSFGLQQDYEDALNRAQKILKKLDALFALDDEQRAVLENHTMKKGGEWES